MIAAERALALPHGTRVLVYSAGDIQSGCAPSMRGALREASPYGLVVDLEVIEDGATYTVPSHWGFTDCCEVAPTGRTLSSQERP